MKVSRLTKALLAFGVVAACLLGLAACSSSESSSGGVAATVNGTEIPEQKITDQIEQIRTQSGLTDEDQWGQFLVENEMTPSSVREQIIDTLTEQELIVAGAQELGITVEDSEIDDYVNQMKENYDSDEAWASALEQAGFTEDEYRETIKESLYEQKVGDHFEEDADLTDEDYVNSAQTYASYYDGAKRSSHILFSVEDTSDEDALAEANAKASEVLAEINAGTLDFAEAAKEYSGDESSAENGGDVGWDVLNSFVTEYTNALSELEVDQVSEPVQSEYGIHIIKCTDVYNAPEDTSTITSLDQIPEAFQDNIKEMAASVKANSSYEEWLDGLKESADIVINDMPSDLPYDIDLTPYQEAADAEDEEDGEDADADADAEADEDADAESVDVATDEDVDDEVVAEEDSSEDESANSSDVEEEEEEATSESSESSSTSEDEGEGEASSSSSSAAE